MRIEKIFKKRSRIMLNYLQFSYYVKIVTPQKVHIACQTMKHFETILPSNRFHRVHKSFIVAVSKINTIIGNTIKISGGELPIGQTYMKEVCELLNVLGRIH